MLTPQEVSERAFQKARVGGYNMAQVDEFLDILTQDYSSLYNENAVLKSKMKVLVDKVEEYRATDEAMRKAFMTAQRMADDLVKEAEQKKAQILAEAEGEVRQRLAELVKEREAEEYRLQQAQNNTRAFVDVVRAMHAKEAEFLSRLQDLCPPEEEPQVDPVEEAASEIDDNVQRLLAKAMADAAEENRKAQEAEQDDLSDTAEFAPVSAEEKEEPDDGHPSGSRIDFGELQFGRDYEIK